MKFHLSHAAGKNMLTGYGSNFVMVNQQRYAGSIIVMPGRLIENWPIDNFTALLPEHFAFLASLVPEVVLLGTGDLIRFPHPRLSHVLTDAGIGLEVMSTGAACRTYNVLMDEGRNVAAALLLPKSNDSVD